MKFRVTYWPGTAKLRPCCVKDMAERGELDSLARTYTIEAASWEEAQSSTIYLMDDSRNGAREGSDGCLIEYVKECDHCKTTYYTSAEDSVLCHECGELSVLA